MKNTSNSFLDIQSPSPNKERIKAVSKMLKRVKSNDAIQTIGSPENFQHHVHVDLNYKWTGEDPAQTFQLGKQLGFG